MSTLEYDVVIIGGGIAGIVTAIELLDQGMTVAIIERDKPSNLGGQAKEAFGGMWFVDTPLQRKNNIKDSKDLAKEDWFATAEYSDTDIWPKKWANAYIEEGSDFVYNWLQDLGMSFIPAPGWVERGNFTPGNSLPRYHIIWGTSEKLARTLVTRLERHKKNKNLKLFFNHEVEHFIEKDGTAVGCTARNKGNLFNFYGKYVIISSGGVTGSEEKVRQLWPKEWPKAPEYILNGSHPFSDGKVHDLASNELAADVTNVGNFWNYAAGIHHPYSERSDANHGASLIPPRSGLWADRKGKRIGPMPLISGFDTRDLCINVCKQDKGYTWQIMNWKIAKRELAISGSIFNEAIRYEKKIKLVADLITAPDTFLKKIVKLSKDFVVADELTDLVSQMNNLTNDESIDEATLKQQLESYDRQLDIKSGFSNDDQVRRVQNLSQWKGDKFRLATGQKILDSSAGPLVAIRMHLLTRKSLGGIKTNLASQVLKKDDTPIDGLYAIGEASGFGGGGINGKRSLEGTFLSLCIFNGIKAANHIKKQHQEEK